MFGATAKISLGGTPEEAHETGYLEDITVRRIVLELYDAEHVPLRRYLYFLGVDQETTHEVVQEVFLRLHEHLERGGDRSNLRAWLYRVAHNLARTQQTGSHTTRTDPLPESNDELVAEGASAEQKLLDAERTGRFQRALNELSPAQRSCLVLRTRGLKYREIAEALGLSVSSVGENIQRGIERLRELL